MDATSGYQNFNPAHKGRNKSVFSKPPRKFGAELESVAPLSAANTIQTGVNTDKTKEKKGPLVVRIKGKKER